MDESSWNSNTTLYLKLVLHLLDSQYPFEIETNASHYATSAILKWVGHPTNYHSKTLTNANLKYNTYDKEFWDLVKALKQWCHYVLDKENNFCTNNHPLIFWIHSLRVKNNSISNMPPTYNSFTWSLNIRKGVQIRRQMCWVSLQLNQCTFWMFLVLPMKLGTTICY